jgi:hypothetical protein
MSSIMMEMVGRPSAAATGTASRRQLGNPPAAGGRGTANDAGWIACGSDGGVPAALAAGATAAGAAAAGADVAGAEAEIATWTVSAVRVRK